MVDLEGFEDAPDYFTWIDQGHTHDKKFYCRFRVPANRRQDLVTWIRNGGHYVFRHFKEFSSSTV